MPGCRCVAVESATTYLWALAIMGPPWTMSAPSLMPLVVIALTSHPLEHHISQSRDRPSYAALFPRPYLMYGQVFLLDLENGGSCRVEAECPAPVFSIFDVMKEPENFPNFEFRIQHGKGQAALCPLCVRRPSSSV